MYMLLYKKDIKENIDRSVFVCKYDDLIAIFPRKSERKQNITIFQ